MTAADEMPELNPCPFCGGSVTLEQTESRDELYGRRKWWGVVCRSGKGLGGSCAVQIAPSASIEAATERWNTRADTHTALAAVAKEMAEALRKTQFGFNHRRCSVCAGWDKSPAGETDHAHTEDCPVKLALTAYEKLMEGK